MPAPRTVHDFLELVRKSGLVDKERLSAFLAGAGAAEAAREELPRLARRLVSHGLLTFFQAEQLLRGRWRPFTIGKYRILEYLGAGRAGCVYLCLHVLSRRRAAVKVLPASRAGDPAAVERFYREARALAALNHPNVARAYDCDRDGDLHFLAMEYVDGSSLQHITEKSGPMAALRAAHYVRQAALGLQHIHERGLVHRDVKPGHVLVDRGGAVKVIGPGLARLPDDEPALTTAQDGAALGTPEYTAPEQAIDPASADIRADVYSLGATFYFCLTGQPPSGGGTAAQQPTRGRARHDLPKGLEGLIERMMAEAPARRPQTAREVAHALAPYTLEAVAPPSEDEMPRLCPAASGRQPPPAGDAPD